MADFGAFAAQYEVFENLIDQIATGGMLQLSQQLVEEEFFAYEDAARLGFVDQLTALQSQQERYALNAGDPAGGRRTVDAQVAQNEQRQIDYLAGVTITDTINSVVAQADLATSEAVQELGVLYKKIFNNRWRQVVRINEEVAQLAVKDMVEHYDQVYKSRHRSMGAAQSPYRRNARYAGGLLRAALANPLQGVGNLDGVTFGNTSLLDATAKHWARLNFGAGPRAGNRGGPISPDITPYQTARLSASQEFFSEALDLPPVARKPLPFSARGTFYMPAGLWLVSPASTIAPNRARRGMDMFYPAAEVPKNMYDRTNDNRTRADGTQTHSGLKITQGVQAWGFLEAGVDSVARNLPRANRDYLLSIFDEAAEAGKSLPTKTINVSPTIRRLLG